MVALISIPMAVYNGENFLHRSLQSVLNQDSPNWELICINDGSTDSSAAILEHYSKNDRRIKVISQNNSGPARARIQGYRAASGDFIFTGLDQDDYLAPDFVSSMTQAVDKMDVDVLLCDWMIEQDDGKFTSFIAKNGFKVGQVFEGVEAFKLTFPWRLHAIGLWSKSLSQRFATDAQHAFNNYDSEEYLGRLIFLNSKKIAIGPGRYFHCRNEDSITTKPSLKKLQSLDTNERLVRLARTHRLGSEVLWQIFMYQRNYLANIMRMLGSFKNRETSHLGIASASRTCREFLKSLKCEIRQNPNDLKISRLKSESIILKLELRYALMKINIFINKHLSRPH